VYPLRHVIRPRVAQQPEDLLGAVALQDVVARAVLEARAHGLQRVLGGHHDGDHVRVALEDAPQREVAVQLRHVDVEQHHVRPRARRHRHRLFAVLRFPDHAGPEGRHDGADHPADMGLVLRDQHADLMILRRVFHGFPGADETPRTD